MIVSKISMLRTMLELLEREHGDLPVVVPDWMSDGQFYYQIVSTVVIDDLVEGMPGYGGPDRFIRRDPGNWPGPEGWTEHCAAHPVRKAVLLSASTRTQPERTD